MLNIRSTRRSFPHTTIRTSDIFLSYRPSDLWQQCVGACRRPSLGRVELVGSRPSRVKSGKALAERNNSFVHQQTDIGVLAGGGAVPMLVGIR
jgi:hypothetical protein